VMKKFYHNEPPRDVHVVETVEEARRVVALLMTDEMAAGRTFACDTEVMGIDVTRESPCCHGTVTCFSLYCGPDVDFGGSGTDRRGDTDTDSDTDVNDNRTMLWVDTWLNGDEGRAAEALEILETFRPFFESSAHRKVWHNYSFDRHVMERMGITCKGFFGDTMHMARLWDSSRTGRGGYSLEALTTEEELMGPLDMSDARGKISMKKIFGRKNIKKDGTEGKLILLPPVEELQRGAETRWDWVNYSAYDAKATWDLHEALVLKLMNIYTTPDADVYRCVVVWWWFVSASASASALSLTRRLADSPTRAHTHTRSLVSHFFFFTPGRIGTRVSRFGRCGTFTATCGGRLETC